MKDKKIFCFGELLLRLSPLLQGKWLQEASMPVYAGGAELNVATALARWDIPVKYCSAIPDNYLSREICESLVQKKIDISGMVFSGNRIGMYILPQGADLKHAGVIYDRAHSGFSELQPGTLDWDTLLKNVGWFHFSAIGPALSENAAAVCKEGLENAARRGIGISVDLNYRSKLWQYGKSPGEVMAPLVRYCDLIMGNIWAADTLLGIPVDDSIHQKASREAYLEHARQTSIAMVRSFPNCKTVANTFRFDHGEGGIRYYTSLYSNGEHYQSREFIAENIVDKVGSGDCFMAGLMYGLYHNQAPQEILNFATAAAFGKLYEQGDATRQDIASIKSITRSHG